MARVALHPLRVAPEKLLARVVSEGRLELVQRKVDGDHPRLQLVVAVVRERQKERRDTKSEGEGEGSEVIQGFTITLLRRAGRS